MTFHQDYLDVNQPAIGQLIRELWQSLKLTQEKFAVQLGVTFLTINRWENGHATPSPLAFRQIETLFTLLSKSPDSTLREYTHAMQRKYFLARELKA